MPFASDIYKKIQIKRILNNGEERMKKYLNMIMAILLGGSILLLTSCFSDSGSDGSTEPEQNNLSEANVIATAGFDNLNDEIQNAEISIDDPQSGDDIFPEATYNSIKGKFQEAIDLDSDNPTAHLGMSVLELASINYDKELWDLFDEMKMSFSKDRIFNNQISFLAKAPEFNVKLMAGTALKKGEIMTISKIQDKIESIVIRRLDNAINHLNSAVNLADSSSIYFNTGEENVEIDKGEIYAFRATLNAVAAAFRMMTVYDVDLLDQNNSWDWLTNQKESDYDHYHVAVENGQKVLYLDEYYGGSDSLSFAIIKYNLEERNSFLTFRNDNSAKAKSNIMNFLSDIKAAVAAIENETDSQQDDIIKQSYISQLNQDIADIDTNDANFMQEWQNINDAITWIENLFNNPYTFKFDNNELKVDLGRMFDPGLEDIKEYLPYHQWLPENDWVQKDLDDMWQENHNGENFSFIYEDEMITIENVDKIIYSDYDVEINALQLTDGSGTVIEDELPFLPDYTFNGILPDMTRIKYLELFENKD